MTTHTASTPDGRITVQGRSDKPLAGHTEAHWLARDSGPGIVTDAKLIATGLEPTQVLDVRRRKGRLIVTAYFREDIYRYDITDATPEFPMLDLEPDRVIPEPPPVTEPGPPTTEIPAKDHQRLVQAMCESIIYGSCQPELWRECQKWLGPPTGPDSEWKDRSANKPEMANAAALRGTNATKPEKVLADEFFLWRADAAFTQGHHCAEICGEYWRMAWAVVALVIAIERGAVGAKQLARDAALWALTSRPDRKVVGGGGAIHYEGSGGFTAGLRMLPAHWGGWSIDYLMSLLLSPWLESPEARDPKPDDWIQRAIEHMYADETLEKVSVIFSNRERQALGAVVTGKAQAMDYLGVLDMLQGLRTVVPITIQRKGTESLMMLHGQVGANTGHTSFAHSNGPTLADSPHGWVFCDHWTGDWATDLDHINHKLKTNPKGPCVRVRNGHPRFFPGQAVGTIIGSTFFFNNGGPDTGSSYVYPIIQSPDFQIHLTPDAEPVRAT